MSASRIRAGLREVERISDTVAGGTDIGLRRATNEDAFWMSRDGAVLAVADGLGGLPAGEVASRIAIEVVRECWRLHAGADPGSWLGGAFETAQQRIVARANAVPEYRGMATTLVVAATDQDAVHVAHVGDVRAYRGTGNALELLTCDHTRAWELVEAGELPAEAIRGHPWRNMLTEALGAGTGKPSMLRTAVGADDVILLCSDGLWEPVREDEILKVLREESEASACVERLLDMALERGGPDNVTVVMRRGY